MTLTASFIEELMSDEEQYGVHTNVPDMSAASTPGLDKSFDEFMKYWLTLCSVKLQKKAVKKRSKHCNRLIHAKCGVNMQLCHLGPK